MSLNLSIIMNASVERGLIESHTNFVQKCLAHLNEKGMLNCNLDEALGIFDFEAISLTSKRSAASRSNRSKTLKTSVKKTTRNSKTKNKCDLISKLVAEASNELFGDQPVSESGDESDSSVASTQSKKELKAEKKKAKVAAKLAKAEAKEIEKLAKAEAKEVEKLAKAAAKEVEKLAKEIEKRKYVLSIFIKTYDIKPLR